MSEQKSLREDKNDLPAVCQNAVVLPALSPDKLVEVKIEKDGALKSKSEMTAVSKESCDGSEGSVRCSYSVVVRTSCESNADDIGSVVVQMIDTEGGESDKSRLRCSVTHRSKFKPGHSDLFVLVDQQPLKDLKTVKVWLQKKKKEDAWKLHSINVIKHDEEHYLYRFPCGKWIGKGTDTDVWSQVELDVVGKPFKVLHSKDFSLDA